MKKTSASTEMQVQIPPDERLTYMVEPVEVEESRRSRPRNYAVKKQLKRKK